MPSLFLALCVAIYPYQAQSPQELSLAEGDVLYILDKNTEDDWWKAKKRMVGAEEDEPVGLVPNNYVESLPVTGKARAMYDYDRQTDEEVTIKEDEILDVYDTSDPDWVLVGVRDEYGFAPSNYLEFVSDAQLNAAAAAASMASPQSAAAPVAYQPPVAQQPIPQQQPPQQYEPQYDSPQQQYEETPPPQPVRPQATGQRSYHSDSFSHYRQPEPEYDEDEEEEAPRLPSRPRAQSAQSNESIISPSSSSPSKRNTGFLKWSVQEVDGKKKYKATLGIGNGSVMFSPESEKSSSSSQQWSITNLVHYNSEKKHVFLEFEHPSVSLDLHAGSKDAAQEIMSALGDLVGAKRASGLREVIHASVPTGQRYGRALYDFDAEGADEVTIREGDDVFILDDSMSDEWIVIKHALSGSEGVVPRSYIEIIRKPSRKPTIEEEESPQKSKRSSKRESRVSRRESHNDSPPPKAPSKPKPDPSKIRTWTDRTGSFKVEAAFVGLQDGKIQLHKVNGVKIAVAANKMSIEDLDYVERLTGEPLRPESSTSSRRRSTMGVVPSGGESGLVAQRTGQNGANHNNGARKSSFDWFEFFLSCGVDYNNCQRYAINFDRDQMDESVLPEISQSVMRMLGLKEGDIIRVKKVIDEKYGKKSAGQTEEANEDGTTLFAGPGGALKNNTRKSRPAPAVTTSTSVDGSLLAGDQPPPQPRRPEQAQTVGDLLSSSANDSQASTPAPAPVQRPEPTGALRDLMNPLVPSPAPIQQSQPTGPSQQQQQPPAPLVSAITGQQAQPNAQYAALQPKIVYQQPPQQQIVAPTGMIITSQPQQIFTAVSAAPQQVPMNTIFVQSPPPQQAQPVFYGIQRPAPPPPVQAQPQPNGGGTVFIQQTGYPGQSPFQNVIAQPLQAQPTRQFVPQSQFGIAAMQTGFGGVLQPQQTAFQPQQQQYQPQQLQSQPTGWGFGNGPPGGRDVMTPLVPTKTGPPPKVSFGVNAVQPTPTGKRQANLAAATAENPFGF
ncbi:actin cytoskeleton-regulatory complex protein sla1 [Myxozyma melibiosi]|uniref:Actin cytoskeleton-regulatory complex protein SLA1 n=1 Tax=Myxozyma melibiosi TaxID=54550 RepID=A0ABR1F874_9ASCO